MSVRLRACAVGIFVWVAIIAGVRGQSPSTPMSSPGAVITGSIVDDTLMPVTGVTLTLEQSDKTIATHDSDAAGLFRFERVRPGSYRLRAARDGYPAVTKNVTIRSATATVQVAMEMTRSAPASPAPALPAARLMAPLMPVVAQPGGGVSGRVTDLTGGALPGVTVTLSGPSLTAPQVTVTAPNGAYTFPAVPVGTYSISFELAGFKKYVRAGLVITTGFGAQVDTRMEVGAVSTEVNVSAGPPVIDTKKTSTGSTFTKDIAENRPVGQQMGGSTYGTSSNVQWNLQGGSITDLSSNSNPSYFDFDSFQPVYSHPPFDTASYAHHDPNGFRLTAHDPLSTFGADVDTASYTNVRRFLNEGQLPPVDAVRVEEFINYFRFDYAKPSGDRPVGVTTEIGPCPWAPAHKLVLVGLHAQPVERERPEGRNLVFLIDVSGSMAPLPRLPLIKTAMRMFADTLQPDDTVSIVTYAGTSGLALAPTPARYRDRIHDVIDSLSAGGSTNGGAGLMLAYRVARQQFIPGGVNRVILATDGDFNVGVTGPLDLLHLIEREKQSGVFLSVLGVGNDNVKDSTMEMLADKGNGHYAYLDSLQEARRVLIREGDAIETVAKDVKFQVEFNPAAVQAWRLIGYEDRALAHEDFNNDRKDGGELGAGHTVTVLYEVVPAGEALPGEVEADLPPVIDPLKYQLTLVPAPAASNGEWMTVKIRYKRPDADESRLMTEAVRPGRAARFLPFASTVAEFGLLLRDGQASAARWDAFVARAHALGDAANDPFGERLGFVQVVDLAAGLRKLK